MALDEGDCCFDRLWKVFINFRLIQESFRSCPLKAGASNDSVGEYGAPIFSKKKDCAPAGNILAPSIHDQTESHHSGIV
jgi:hypothetical protein